MLQSRLRGPVSVLITPICRFLLQIGLRANHLTVIGAFGSSICAIYFFSQGKFLVGTLLVTIFLLTDLLDGTMARLSSGTGTKWGAFLDSTVDRIADAALLIGILAYISEQSGKNFSRWSEALVLATLVMSFLVSYVRARAEALGIDCAVGIGERTERLVVLLIGTGFYGLGFDAAIDTSLWLVLVMSTVTVIQRVIVVARA
jgi:CDP-diacylglycerol--glycerol-3-phosphate 3-phosphatidyltransferase